MKKTIWYILIGILLVGCTTEQEQEFRDRYEDEINAEIDKRVDERLAMLNITLLGNVTEDPVEEIIIEIEDIYDKVNLKLYPYVFLQQDSVVFNGVMVVGKDAESRVIIGAMDVITSFQVYDIGVGVYRLDTEVELWEENMILFGNPCNNRLIAEVMGLEYPTCKGEMGIEKHTGLIKLYNKESKYTMVVAGYDYDDILMASKYLAQHKYNLEGYEAKIVKVYQPFKTEVIVKK